jgi:hypothetical protein
MDCFVALLLAMTEGFVTSQAIPKQFEAMREGIASSLALLAMTSLTSLRNMR